MVKYGNSKVYEIEPICDHDEDEVYIGSTTKVYLSDRMVKHRSDYKRWKEKKEGGKISAFDLFDKYGVENRQIILLENVPCRTKEELVAREAHYIRTMKCVNKVTPNRTKEEYRNDNREKKREMDRVYRESKKRK
jgi:hypothetical protein